MSNIKTKNELKLFSSELLRELNGYGTVFHAYSKFLMELISFSVKKNMLQEGVQYFDILSWVVVNNSFIGYTKMEKGFVPC